MRRRVQYLTETGKKRMLRQHGIIYDRTTSNVLRVHNKNESWGHFLTKAVLYKLFRDKGYTVLLEAETDRGIIDVFILDLELAIEVVSRPPLEKRAQAKYSSKFRDLVVVAVPECELNDFCSCIKEQLQIWL